MRHVLGIFIVGAAACALFVSSSSAAPIPVDSYTGPNGGLSPGYVNSYLDDSYPDAPYAVYVNLSGGKGDLTDDVASTSFLEPTWVGWHVWPEHDTDSPFSAENPLTTTFTLSQLATITSVQIDSFTGSGSIFYPAKITLSFSTDGVTFTDAMDYIPPTETGPTYGTLNITIPNVQADYVKIVSYHSTYTGESWIFYNNVRFEGDAVPEPASLSLLSLSSLVLLKRRRRSSTVE